MHSLSSLLDLVLEHTASETLQRVPSNASQRLCGTIRLVQQALKIQQQPRLGQLDSLRNLLYFVEVLTSVSITDEPQCCAAMSQLFASASQMVSSSSNLLPVDLSSRIPSRLSD